ncbi:hypothetical protein TEA_014885 [Camellia sinensis var. sinensis]|uniref:Uncharacterized protein n=1 Tax=Camellia sinensis var. sinensis TaxID=542762 RepID=A0A4S4E1K1_CAMSN|nr:hypothetical protein TEA_014885 [Camellia sinensis var. sinensis]
MKYGYINKYVVPILGIVGDCWERPNGYEFKLNSSEAPLSCSLSLDSSFVLCDIDLKLWEIAKREEGLVSIAEEVISGEAVLDFSDRSQSDFDFEIHLRAISILNFSLSISKLHCDLWTLFLLRLSIAPPPTTHLCPSYELNKSKFIAYLRDVKLIYNTMIGPLVLFVKQIDPISEKKKLRYDMTWNWLRIPSLCCALVWEWEGEHMEGKVRLPIGGYGFLEATGFTVHGNGIFVPSRLIDELDLLCMEMVSLSLRCCAKAQNPCHIHVLTSNATFPDKIPSSSSSLFDQQSTDASSSGNSRRFTSLRQLSNNFAQFNNLQGPLRSRKTVTRKDAAVINEWRFLKLKEHKEGKIEVENEAFDRYMQNVSLLDEVLTVDSTPEGSTNNWPPRSENVTKRVQDIVNQGLRKLQKIELGNGDNDSTQNEEDLKYCLEMKPELFNHHQRTSQMETEEVIEISKQETANNEFSPGLQSDYSIPKWFCTANVDQDALDLIDVRFSSLEEIEAL